MFVSSCEGGENHETGAEIVAHKWYNPLFNNLPDPPYPKSQVLHGLAMAFAGLPKTVSGQDVAGAA
ncbi:hypothetical protein GCM10009113_07250 [Marinobacter szutsaonensis]